MTTIAAPPLSAVAKSKYREAIRMCHPDHVPADRIAAATKLAQELNDARDLADEKEIARVGAKVRRWAEGKDHAPNRGFTTEFRMKMIRIQPGISITECRREEDKLNDRGSPSLANIPEAFWMAKTPVTQSQWRKVMGREVPFPMFRSHSKPSFPVTNVSWKEANEFCARATEQSEHSRSIRFTLPTEAQWEYAYHAGRTAPVSGCDLLNLFSFDGYGFMKTSWAAALNKRNALGLHDMYGRVFEWCGDLYSIDSPSSAVCRGGWWVSLTNPGLGSRFYLPLDLRNAILGFRVAAVHL